VLDTLLTFVVVGIAMAYAVGVRRLWGAATTARLVSSMQAAAFAAAVVVLLAALSSPFDELADRNLPWHMVQHLMLMTVAAPLIAASDAVLVLTRALPLGGRRRVSAVTRRVLRSQSSTRGWLAWMLVAFVVWIVTLDVWHVPALYDAAIRSPALHALEHATYLLTATLFWWMALGATRRSRRGLGVLVVFAASLPASALGILMTLAHTSWYSSYGQGAATLRRQQVAGSIMWGFGGSALVVVAAALFASWLWSLERSEPSQPAPPPIVESWR
jgi:cytochrome c oxidase assembly factor CtaG